VVTITILFIFYQIDWKSDQMYESSIAVKDIVNWLKERCVTKSLVLLDACREEMTASKSAK